MIERRTGSVLEAEAEALVNTVNCVGVMGKGVALLMKRAYPQNYKAYRAAFEAGQVAIGRMLTVDLAPAEPPPAPKRSKKPKRAAAAAQAALPGMGTPSEAPDDQQDTPLRPRSIINFPTKDHWRDPSRLSYITDGLPALIAEVRRLKLRSIALPALGCGNGGLDWEQVRPLIEAAFAPLPEMRVLLYEPHTELPALTPEEAALVRVTAAYQAEGYRLSAREVASLAELLRCAAPASLTPLDAPPAWLVPCTLDGGESWAVAEEVAQAAEKALRRHPASERAARHVQQVIAGWETPYSLEVLATVHRLAHATPAASAADMIAAAEAWPGPVRSLLRPAHIERAQAHLRDHNLLPTARMQDAG